MGRFGPWRKKLKRVPPLPLSALFRHTHIPHFYGSFLLRLGLVIERGGAWMDGAWDGAWMVNLGWCLDGNSTALGWSIFILIHPTSKVLLFNRFPIALNSCLNVVTAIMQHLP
tara:strand:- start:320 stop:658 length:339 start_codon:yes stop_codon:yes gene_type:complete